MIPVPAILFPRDQAGAFQNLLFIEIICLNNINLEVRYLNLSPFNDHFGKWVNKLSMWSCLVWFDKIFVV